jgi:hypothetical protein
LDELSESFRLEVLEGGLGVVEYDVKMLERDLNNAWTHIGRLEEALRMLASIPGSSHYAASEAVKILDRE